MIITCLGHAKFLLQLENGMKLITDPFDAGTGYPIKPLDVDAVLVSHGHHDHCATDTLGSFNQVIKTAGVHTLAPDVRVTAVPSFHDEVMGAKRGSNLIMRIEAEGLRVVHLGDLGHPLNDEQIAALRPVDVLMIPVGGYYTIDAETARQVCRQLNPRVILPMHYRTAYNAEWPIAPVDAFLSLLKDPAEELDLLRVAAGDIICQPRAVVLRPQV